MRKQSRKATPTPPANVTDVEKAKFDEAIGRETDPMMLVLRGHLFSESLLERILRLSLARGDKLVESGGLSYAQKLILLESMDRVPDTIASSLRGLNRMRNQCAHELGKVISDADVVRFGSPLGKQFTKIHRESNYEPLRTLFLLVGYLIGYLTGTCHALEEHAVESHKNTMRLHKSSNDK
jgi:hypothetical protein